MPNTGNMGLPICLFAYGSQGLGVAAAISALIILCHFTLGVFLADRKFSINVVIKSPPFYAIIVAVFLLYYDLKLPGFVENTTFLLMYATIFLILMSLGIALTRLKVFSLNKAIFFFFWKSNHWSYNWIFINIIFQFRWICRWCFFIDTVFDAKCCSKLSCSINIFTQKNS